VYWFQPAGMEWSLESIVAESTVPAAVVGDVDELVMQVAAEAQAGDQLVVMSNGEFGGIHQKLLDQLQDRKPL
jgi:UDP-N-acetylmuramate: L-alanyl-gamma-D-glutamyl-meso-diaminopimelate ligase